MNIPLSVLIEVQECLSIANVQGMNKTTNDTIRIAKATGTLRYYMDKAAEESAEVVRPTEKMVTPYISQEHFDRAFPDTSGNLKKVDP